MVCLDQRENSLATNETFGRPKLFALVVLLERWSTRWNDHPGLLAGSKDVNVGRQQVRGVQCPHPYEASNRA